MRAESVKKNEIPPETESHRQFTMTNEHLRLRCTGSSSRIKIWMLQFVGHNDGETHWKRISEIIVGQLFAK